MYLLMYQRRCGERRVLWRDRRGGQGRLQLPEVALFQRRHVDPCACV